MPDEVVQTPFGKFLVNDQDLIESTLKAGTLWDGPGFLQVIAREYAELGTPGVTVLDVGANVGSFSIWLASRGAWRVIAVEPVPSTMRRLKANLDLNREVTADRVIPLELAAYDRLGVLWAPAVDPTNVGGVALSLIEGANGVRVEAAPLDLRAALFGRRVSLIKIDAQGCDGAIIRGLRQTLQRDHPAVVFEWDADLALPHGWTLGDTYNTLHELGYMVEPWPSHPGNYLARWAR